jgi:hypothetical protein
MGGVLAVLDFINAIDIDVDGVATNATKAG